MNPAPPDTLADRLRDRAEEFAERLTNLVRGTITNTGEFIVTPLDDDRPKAWIFPKGSTPISPRPIDLDVNIASGESCPLWLRAAFQVDLTDDKDEHLRVLTSMFALCVTPDTQRPAIRIEYDRDKGSEPDDETPGTHARAAAHVQIHGSSPELAWAYGRLGTPMRDLSKIHIPVGGRRFRPSLEDFIEFLNAEQLMPGIHPNWRAVLAEHRQNWLTIQLRAATRNNPATAANELRRLGYEVIDPAD